VLILLKQESPKSLIVYCISILSGGYDLAPSRYDDKTHLVEDFDQSDNALE
jgi:hypothetical protein